MGFFDGLKGVMSSQVNENARRYRELARKLEVQGRYEEAEKAHRAADNAEQMYAKLNSKGR